MTLQDIPQVAAIEKASFPNPWPGQFFRRCMLAGFRCSVIERASQICGYSVLRLTGVGGHLLNLCIRESDRGKGYGREMLDETVAFCRAASIQRILLEVRLSNKPAVQLYESAGFWEAGVRPDYYSDSEGVEDALVLVLELD